MNDLYDEILEIIRKGTNLINGTIQDAEDYLNTFVKKLLSNYNNKGNLEFDESDFKLSKKVREAVEKAVQKSGFTEVAIQFIPILNKIEEITKRIAKIANPEVKFSKDVLDLTQDKKLVIEQITAALSSPASIKANITGELQRIIYGSIKNQIAYKDALQILTPLISGDAEKGGLLSRYYKTITRDTLNQWNGAINQGIATKYGLIDVLYAGGKRTNSRPQCIRWVDQLGGVMTKEVIESEMKKAIKTIRKPNDQFKGYSVYAVPTTENFTVVRGGHNCQHRATPTLLTPEKAESNIKKYNALGNSVKMKYQNVRED